MRQLRYFKLISLLIIAVLTSCQKGELNLGDDSIGSPTYTALIDTVSVQFSSIKVDSLVTSSTGHGLVGYYHHPLMGGQEAKTYFSLSAPAEFEWDETDEVFDSLVLILHSNAYSIGDTLVDALFNVYPLSEEIEVNDDGKLYNTSTFKADDIPIGTEKFRPYPKDKEDINLRIDDSYANEIINFLVDYENHDDKQTLFKERFKGFVIQSDTVSTRSAIGFAVGDTSSYLRLYYHTVDLEKKEHIKDFSLSSSSQHFNELSSPNDQVVYNQIPNGKAVLKDQESNGVAVLQAGSGFKIRIDFPTLNNLLELKAKGHIVKAELRLRPDMNIMETSDLPSQVYIGDIYIANDIWGYLTDGNNNPIASQLALDNMYHEETYYAFDLTSYINTRLTEQVVDLERGLVITLPDTNMGSSYTWLALNGQSSKNNQSELLLYYYYYDTE